MRNLLEIGDSFVAPLTQINNPDRDAAAAYTFTIPIPDRTPAKYLKYTIGFVHYFFEPMDIGSLFQNERELDPELIELCGEAQEILEDEAKADSLRFNAWDVIFSNLDEQGEENFEALNLNDKRVTLTVMNTVKKAMIMFLDSHREDIDLIHFTAKKKDHGRVFLYRSFAKTLAQKLGWEVVEGTGWITTSQAFLIYDPEMFDRFVGL